MTKSRIVFILLTLTLAASATEKVDQGRPGSQGPWPVTLSGSGGSVVVYVDGGFIQTYPILCRDTDDAGTGVNKSTNVGVAAVPVPASSSLNRIYVEICNSLQNTGNPLMKCRADGTAPVNAIGSGGTMLGIGDCVQFAVPAANAVQCIADSANTYATSYECIPL